MPQYVVRHGVMRILGVFSSRKNESYKRGCKVIARTSRGMEAGEVLCEATEAAIAQLEDPQRGQIVRAVSSTDGHELEKMVDQEVSEFETCKMRIAELKLEMRLVDIEHLYGGERVVIYYLAEGRVDFRELVKLLAKDFQTRIEMRQIGVRDEAKLLADYGDCGKPVCCNNHLFQMPPVSMKMAKLQKATLDPSKISGRCGRLKCCLRYEYDTYLDLQRDLPPIGSEIITNNGRAKVLAQEIISAQLLVENEEHRRVMISATEVLTILKKGSGYLEPRNRKSVPKETGPKADSTARASAVTTKESGDDPKSKEAESKETGPSKNKKQPSDKPKNHRKQENKASGSETSPLVDPEEKAKKTDPKGNVQEP